MARNGRNAYRRELVDQWKPNVLLWVSLIMSWVPGNTLEERFSTARRIVKFIKPHWTVPVAFSGFLDAQQRLWPQMAATLLERLRPDEASSGEAWRVLGWLVLAVDGSRLTCPRTDANEEELGCAGQDKTAPQISQTLLQHVGTGLPWDYCLGPGTASEQRHLNEMLADLPPQTLLTADAGFVSFDLCSQLIDTNTCFVLRIGGNKTLIEELDEEERGEDIVYFWPQNEQSKQPLKLRRICFESAGGLPVVLLTNVLDPQILSDETAKEIYRSRWGIEVDFRHLKQTMNLAALHSRTPKRVYNEHHWQLISFWALQRMVVTQQIALGQDPRRFSAAKVRREIREVLQLMQQERYGAPLAQRLAKAEVDRYQRRGAKTKRSRPRKKIQTPPDPPKTRRATPHEIKKAKRLAFKSLLIS